MNGRMPAAVVAAALATILSVSVSAQGRGGAPPAAPVAAREAAPQDITGYWVSVVTEDWRFRMVTPPKGDYASVPLNPEGRRVADTWDPAKDEAAGNQCRSYGAAALMRVPGRLHITWADEDTLKIETDAGTQTREFHFKPGQPPAGDAGWQGYSAANWEIAGGRGGQGQRPGSMKVVTTHMRPGYLRKNGVPYSGNAVLTEYYTRTDEPNGDTWLIITTIVEDPQYLAQNFVTSTHFKKEPNGSKWSPTPCAAR
ncbi:MAG: hypothetical protein C5B51_11010 [Terriglobia bacterium]|nr:MAG: hypothetical protein C5B51_11010 [Terriglobia bacterium]